jgi:chemotaxis protein histidine kinase CheA/ActR/RegA family two-component response regulator
MEPAPNEDISPHSPDQTGEAGVPIRPPKPHQAAAPKLQPAFKPPAVPTAAIPTLKLNPKIDSKPAATKPLATPTGLLKPPALRPPAAAFKQQPSLPVVSKPIPKLAASLAASKPAAPDLPALPNFPAKAKPSVKISPVSLPPQQPAVPTEPEAAQEAQEDLTSIFREEVESYLSPVVTALNQLASDIQSEPSWQQLKTRYHAMKGAANTVGLPESGTRAAEAEQAALDAYEYPEKRTAACRDQLIHALQDICRPLDLELPEILPVTETKPQPVIPRAELMRAVPDITPVNESILHWQQQLNSDSKNAFILTAEGFRDELQQNNIAGLHHSFSQLVDFCSTSLSATDTAPPEIFFSVIQHALNDARIYLEALRSDPHLGWSRKWGFYFSSLQIALASQTGTSLSASTLGQLAEDRDPEMVAAFLEEAEENLQHIEQALIAWENGQEPAEKQAELRRHFHTLKGAANSVGLAQLGSDFHILEDAMDQTDTDTAARNFLPHLFRCLDEARSYIQVLQSDAMAPWPGDWMSLLHPDKHKKSPAEVAAGTSPELELAAPIDPDMLEVFIEETETLVEPIEAAIMSLEAGENQSEQQGLLRRHFHTLKGAANSVGLTGLGAEFHVLEDFMDGELAGANSSSLTSFLLNCLDHLRAYIGELQRNPKFGWPYQWAASIASLKQGETPAAQTVSANSDKKTTKSPAAEKQMLRVEAGQLQELMHLISELVAEQTKIQDYVSRLRALQAELQHVASDPELKPEHRASLKTTFTELSDIRERLNGDDQLFRRYAKRIQSDLVELNMGPVGSLFHRLSRSFRDACQEENKEAKWLPEGGDVQLDRAVVDQLYGPLLHVVRNAVAHGIESPEKRKAAGKDPCGTVRIQAISKSDHVNIVIIDDGAGINENAIRKKAIERGLIDDSVTSITSEQAIEILFSPGFSTKEAVTNVAGRGVGLDVVKGDIEGLNGSVGVTYVQGQGTTWKIRVPLTLSASEALLVQASEFKVALPLGMVDRCTRLQPNASNVDAVLNSIALDGETLPLLNLGRFLGSSNPGTPTHAVVVDTGLGRAALAVTALLARREVVTKDPGPLLAPLSFYSGVTSDSDGKLLPILQIPYLLEWITKRESTANRNQLPVPTQETESEFELVKTPEFKPDTTETAHDSGNSPVAPVVLLADDSPSVRKVQEKQLVKLGFTVLLAKDGQEAIELLQASTPARIDLLVTDWEMPRMNGAQLLQSTRDHPATRNLPVIVISSKVNDAFEIEAKGLGATASLGKPFQAQQFLSKLNSTPELAAIIPMLEAHGQDRA